MIRESLLLSLRVACLATALVTVIGLTIGAFSAREPEAAEQNFRELMEYVAEGKLSPHVSHRLSLEQAAEAMQIIKDRRVIGKVVLN